MSMVSRANCRSRSLLSLFVSDHDATPPLPVLPPGRFWKSISYTFTFTKFSTKKICLKKTNIRYRLFLSKRNKQVFKLSITHPNTKLHLSRWEGYIYCLCTMYIHVSDALFERTRSTGTNPMMERVDSNPNLKKK